jgi:hypothetical protein
MGMRLCSTLGFGSCPYPNVSSARCFPGYPDSANKTRLVTTVRVTLNTTLIRSQTGTLFPSPLEAFSTVGHDRGSAIISKTTSSETASR